MKSIAASVLQMSPVKIDIVAGNFKHKRDMSFCHKPSKRQNIGVKHCQWLLLNGCRNSQPHSPPPPRLWRASFARSVSLRFIFASKKNLRMATLSAWYRVNPQTDPGTVQPSAAKAMEGILRTLRCTPLFLLTQKKIYAWQPLRPAIRSFSEGWWA